MDELAAVIAVVSERLDLKYGPATELPESRRIILLRRALEKLKRLSRPVKSRKFDPGSARCKCGQVLSGHSYEFPHHCNGHWAIGDPDSCETCDCEMFVPI
jgi:hypothetical protein